jgi:hypothetical protein
MAAQTQKNFQQEIPKELDITQPRINLTFRRIEHRYSVLCVSLHQSLRHISLDATNPSDSYKGRP